MRNFIDYLIKNTSSIIYLFLITIALTQIFSRNYYQNSVFNLYFSEIANSFIDEKNNVHMKGPVSKIKNIEINL